MNSVEIIEMVKQTELKFLLNENWMMQDELERFAKLVAAKEREACANLCWKNEDENAFANSYNGKRLDLLCAELIKAKGEQA